MNVNLPKNPLDAWTAHKPDTTLAVKPQFYIANVTGEKPESPGEIDSTFSRIVISIIQTGEGSVNANFPLDRWEALEENFKVARMIDMQEKLRPKPVPVPGCGNSTNDNLAKSIKIAFGKLKGKTPYEVLLQTDGRKALESQLSFLETKCDNRAENQKQKDAIRQALALSPDNLGNADEAAVTASVIELIDPNSPLIKGNPYKVSGEKNVNGKKVILYPCSEIRVNYNIGNRYPVEIYISNFEAPLIISPNKQQQVDKINKQNEKSKRFFVSADAFFDCFRCVRERRRIFLLMNAEQITRNMQICEAANCLQENCTVTIKSRFEHNGVFYSAFASVNGNMAEVAALPGVLNQLSENARDTDHEITVNATVSGRISLFYIHSFNTENTNRTSSRDSRSTAPVSSFDPKNFLNEIEGTKPFKDTVILCSRLYKSELDGFLLAKGKKGGTELKLFFHPDVLKKFPAFAGFDPDTVGEKSMNIRGHYLEKNGMKYILIKECLK